MVPASHQQPMKHSFLFGGFLGFALCFVSALLAGSDADTALRDAVLCSLLAATLFRWLHGSMSSHASLVLREREQAAASDAASAAAPASGQQPAAA